ncbi:MAG: sulfatase [Chloroflexia bacterium]|nr:sulfatase [Chloroflexia bacterium]
MAQAERPNILFIITDDQRYDTLEHMPVVQRELVARGLSFTNAYVTTPLCCPSRASILTGLYAHHHGVLDNNGANGGYNAFDPSSTLATWQDQSGMRTMLVGKYLNDYANYDIPPGWDEWFGMWDNGERYYNYIINDMGQRRVYGYREEWYSSDLLAEQAIKKLEKKRNQPFFLYLAFTSPHLPAQAAKRDVGEFDDLPLPLHPSFNEEDVSDKPSWIRALPLMGEDNIGIMGELRRNQIAALQSVDRAVGQVVDSLRADGRLDNTWIVFMSDNGLSLGEHRFDARKSCGYEECVRVPLVIVPPPSQAAVFGAPRTDPRLILNIDLPPSLAALAGTEPGRPTDGVNILPMLADPQAAWRTDGLLELWTSDDNRSFRGLRSDRWKYLRYANGEQELYDLSADPHELDNLAGRPAQAGVVAALSARLDVLIAQ